MENKAGKRLIFPAAGAANVLIMLENTNVPIVVLVLLLLCVAIVGQPGSQTMRHENLFALLKCGARLYVKANIKRYNVKKSIVMQEQAMLVKKTFPYLFLLLLLF